MNTSKKDTNGWILCPSQSFPGKFYYFNVINGETVWCLNEADKKSLKEDINIQKIASKCHSYPEPSSPPITDIPKRCNIFSNIKKTIPNITQSYTNNASAHTIPHPTPMFGQAVFPKTLSNQIPCVPNIFWTPIQVPMFVAPETEKLMTDQITQTFERDRELFIQVQACDIPLCQRFVNYERPMINFNKDNRIENWPVFKKLFETSTPTKNGQNNNKINSVSKNYQNQFNLENNINTQIKPNQFYNYQTDRESQVIQQPFSKSIDPIHPSINIEPIINRTQSNKPEKINIFKDLNIHNTTNYFKRRRTKSESEIFIESTNNLKSTYDSCSNPTLTTTIGFDNPMAKEESKELDENDLRMLLEARKRKSDIANVFKSGSTEGKKLKANIEEKVSNAKKVSFNFDNLSYEVTDVTTDEEVDYQYTNASNDENFIKPTIEDLRDLADPSMRSDCWYIVVDTDILLDDFEFIDTFIQTDDSCRLLIPSAIQSDIEAMSKGECRGRHRAIVARQLVRHLAAPPPHIVVQSSDPEEDIPNMFTIDSILNCCLEAIEDECHVVLVTNDAALCNRAKSINVHGYKLQDIKDGVAGALPKVSFDIKKINKSIQNDTKHLSYDISKIHVDAFKKQLFMDDKTHNKMNTQSYILTETSKSTANSDKLINITKLNVPQTNITRPNHIPTSIHDNDVMKITTEIGRDLQKLNLEEKQNLFRIQNDICNNNPCQTNLFDFQRNAKSTTFCSLNEIRNLNHDESLLSFVQRISNPSPTVSYYFRNGPKSNPDQTVFDFRNGIQTPSLDITKEVHNKISSLKASHKEVSDVNQTVSFYFQKDVPYSSQKKSTCEFVKDIQTPRAKIDTQEYSKKENQPVPEYGLTKLKNTNGLTVEDCLNRFYVKNKTMEQRLKARTDEWICSYRQIMEEALCDILQKYSTATSKEMSPPWTLYEAVQCLKNVYNDQQTIKTIVNILCPLLVDNNDKIKSHINPDDFMKILGCGLLLIQYLKNILPNSEVLVEAENSLNDLLHNIDDPAMEAQFPSILKTPVISRSDLTKTGQEARRNFVKAPSDIINYLKKHYKPWNSYNEVSDGKNPLQHVQNQNPQVQDVKIIRTFGKDLKLLKIDNTNTMIMNQPKDKGLNTVNSNMFQQGATKETTERNVIQRADNITSSLNDNKVISKEKVNSHMLSQNQTVCDGPKVIRTIENVNPNLFNIHSENKDTNKKTNELYGNIMLRQESNAESNVISENVKLPTKNDIKQMESDCTVAGDAYNYTAHLNTFEQSKENDGPKVIRNVQAIATYEEKLKKPKEQLDMDLLDYTEIITDDFSQHADTDSRYTNNNYKNKLKTNSDQNYNCQMSTKKYIDVHNNDSYATTNDIYPINNDHSVENNDRLTSRDDVTNDSGFENESLHAHSLVKSFLMELSSSFKMIYRFIDESITEFRNESLRDDKKKLLQDKANKTHTHISDIINKLKSIIVRESNEGNTLKALLINAGVQASTDKRMTRYRQVVTKCLEQAEMLQNALKIMLAVTDGDFNAAMTGNTDSTSSYLNIFE